MADWKNDAGPGAEGISRTLNRRLGLGNPCGEASGTVLIVQHWMFVAAVQRKRAVSAVFG
jgi:hypothetical protein